jgi:azobenzene reductase
MSGILLLGGSLARPSHPSALLTRTEELLLERGAQVERWDLAERTLEPADPADLSRLRAHRREPGRTLAHLAAWADALVVATPLYHGSCSGVVKNALDHLSCHECAGKPMALLCHNGRMPSTQALDHLRLVARALSTVVIPQQLFTIDSDWRLEEDGYRLAGAAAEARLSAVVDQLLDLAVCLARPGRGSGAAVRATGGRRR